MTIIKNIKTVIALAIVSGIMATGLISAFALPNIINVTNIYGDRLVGETAKLNPHTIYGNSVVATNQFRSVQVKIEQGFMKANGSHGWTQSPVYYSNKNKSVYGTLSSGWGTSSEWGKSNHYTITGNDSISRETGYNYKK